MSNFARRFARRNEETRTPRPIMHRAGSKGWVHFAPAGVKQYYADHHSTGDKWWQETLADLVDRRNDDGTYTPAQKAARPPERVMTRPAMAERPAGMTRQVQRALYRKVCKELGVPWRKPQDTTR